MTYTARLNKKITLPSGNWFTGFSVNIETRTIVYTYHDRRRNGQVARHYTVTFKDDLSTIKSVTAVSAHGSRIEYFSTVSIRGDLANILRAAVSEAWEKSFADEVKQIKQKKFNLSAFLYGLFIVLVLIEVVTCGSLFIIPEGTEIFEIISKISLTNVFGTIIAGLLAVQNNR